MSDSIKSLFINYDFDKNSSFSRRRESSVFNAFLDARLRTSGMTKIKKAIYTQTLFNQINNLEALLGVVL
jgi:hypothetical protein